MTRVYFELKPAPTIRHRPKPILSAIFKNPNDKSKIFPVICLLDSGADYCTLPIEAESILGLELKKSGCERNQMECACGNEQFTAYKIKLNVVTFDENKKPIEMLLNVAFCGSNTMPLIGRNYMDMFKKINYDNIKQKGYLETLREIND